MKIKKFEGLLKSEIKKAVKYANMRDNLKACYVSGYYTDHKVDDAGFLTVECEVCNSNNRVGNVLINVCLWDRRQSFVLAHDCFKSLSEVRAVEARLEAMEVR